MNKLFCIKCFVIGLTMAGCVSHKKYFHDVKLVSMDCRDAKETTEKLWSKQIEIDESFNQRLKAVEQYFREAREREKQSMPYKKKEK